MKKGIPMDKSNDRILIIDDDPEILKAYRSVLAPEDEVAGSSGNQLAKLLGRVQELDPSATPRFQLDFAGQGGDGVQLVEAALQRNEPYAVAFIDIRMPPGIDGMETAVRIRRIDSDIEIVMVTAYSDRSREELVRTVGTPEKLLFLRKPFDPEELIQLALSLSAKWNLARRAEEQKKELQTVLMTTPAAIYTVDKNQCITSWNRAAEQITGYTAAEVVGRPCILKHIVIGQECKNCLQGNSDDANQPCEIEIIDHTGMPRTLLRNGTCIRDRQGRFVRLIESLWDITDRKVAEAALAESEARFRALVETTSDWVWETDKTGCFTYCSPLCEVIYGYRPEELEGRLLFEMLLHPEEIDAGQALFRKCVKNKSGFQNIEHRSRTKDGQIIYIESSGIPVIAEDGQIIGFRGIDRDITRRKLIEKERQELEEQYRQSQKLEALGTLAGAIAHDLNNVLTPIMGGAQLSLIGLDATHPFYDNLKTIESGAKKAADLIRQILAFSRKQVMAPKPLNLTFVIRDFAAILRRLIREDVHLAFHLSEELWTVVADKNQMEQVMMNLVVNARDAVAEGGEITIQTLNREIWSGDSRSADLRLASGAYVVMSVVDNGSGMEPSILARIFDPFFTTKEAGKGTGLGLSTVYGIVKQQGGEIRVESAAGRGTRFDIYFPRCENGVTVADELPAIQHVRGGRETILVAEDNGDVLEMVRAGLQYYGYTVVQAANGIEAVQVFKELQGAVDLLLTDVVMPAMSGQSLAEVLRGHKANLPVLFMSGHPFDVNTHELAEISGNEYIQKPFSPHELARIIRQMLENARNA